MGCSEEITLSFEAESHMDCTWSLVELTVYQIQLIILEVKLCILWLELKKPFHRYLLVGDRSFRTFVSLN